MTDPLPSCPTLAELEQFAVGELADENLRRHLEQCAVCRRAERQIRDNNELLKGFVSSGEAARSAPGSGAVFPAIAGYDILAEIRRGGQGVVYAAAHKATKRKVAVKMLLPGMVASTRQRHRFEREVELVAGLRHPHIVTLFDSGITADGRPYFAMEYICGVPLDEYLETSKRRNVETSKQDQNTSREVMPLFCKVCEAVQYAHQRGIIHRDLKPSNILVDAEGIPHVLDFGVAKALGQDAVSGAYTVTYTGEFMGTLAYAAPEQVQGDPDQVDTRTDVYALGIILYEMLTGTPPHAMNGAISDVIRSITEVDPEPPSSRMRHLNDEMDTIVLTAVAKEKDRRYQSVESLRRDVERYLTGKPISAKGDSTWYLLRKTVRRYRVPVAVAAGFVGLILGFSVWMTMLYRRAVAAERVAELRRTQAVKEAEKLKKVRQFTDDMLTAVSPEVARGRDDTLFRFILEGASARIDAELADQPEVAAALHSTIGNTYSSLEYQDEAEPHLRAALALAQQLYGDPHVETAEGWLDLGQLLVRRGLYEEALPCLNESLRIHRQLNDHWGTVNTLVALGWMSKEKGELDRAESLLREALEFSRSSLGDDHRATAAARNNLGVLLYEHGEPAAAAELFREDLQIHRRVRGDDHPDTIKAIGHLATMMSAQGDNDAAIPLMRQVLAGHRHIHKSPHPEVASMLGNLAFALHGKQEYAEAEALLRESLDMWVTLHGEKHIDVVRYTNNLAVLLEDVGNYAEAERLYRKATAILREIGPDTNWLIFHIESRLGGCLRKMDRFEEAEPVLVHSCNRLQELRGPTDERTLQAVQRVVDLYETWGQPDQAAEYRSKLP